ncbi:hypothetical protein L345_04476, partial [Ophiophagus hannah]
MPDVRKQHKLYLKIIKSGGIGATPKKKKEWFIHRTQIPEWLIRRRRPTPATLVLSSDQSSPDAL